MGMVWSNMNRIQGKFVLDALDQNHKLTEWEAVFIGNLADKPDEYELSEKQNEILNRISQKLD
jgi:hypothetical protein